MGSKLNVAGDETEFHVRDLLRQTIQELANLSHDAEVLKLGHSTKADSRMRGEYIAEAGSNIRELVRELAQTIGVEY